MSGKQLSLGEHVGICQQAGSNVGDWYLSSFGLGSISPASEDQHDSQSRAGGST